MKLFILCILAIFLIGCRPDAIMSKHKPSPNSKKWVMLKYKYAGYKITYYLPKSSYFFKYKFDIATCKQGLVMIDKEGYEIVDEERALLQHGYYDYSLYMPKQTHYGYRIIDSRLPGEGSCKDLEGLEKFYRTKKLVFEVKYFRKDVLEIHDRENEISPKLYIGYIIQIDEYKFLKFFAVYDEIIQKDAKEFAIRRQIEKMIVEKVKIEKIK